jgi:hypothetical protein
VTEGEGEEVGDPTHASAQCADAHQGEERARSVPLTPSHFPVFFVAGAMGSTNCDRAPVIFVTEKALAETATLELGGPTAMLTPLDPQRAPPDG